jgi:hypothetical protein
LLRPRRQWPRRCRAAEERDEVAPFQCPMPPMLPDRQDSTSQLRQETAALQDFNRANVGSGSDSVIRRCRLDVRFARKRTRL